MIRKYSAARKLQFYHIEEEKKVLLKNIKITESSAQVPLKDLMIKTFHRHMEEKSFKKMIYQLQTKNGGKNVKLHMFYKSGYDVASGQSKFKVSENSLMLNHIQTCKITKELQYFPTILSCELVNYILE